ncbi:MAG: M48 family metallopeptidase [Chloroherpetonaceae bacterium]|nr:M48 family metallopeptidase [Chloroherpetonaceae bacterium]MDW8438379.1 M48 family metallopeptidase [Chloroherpetonaceae bacterium]
MKTWQGEAIWKDERETTTVSVSINPYGLSILKAGKEFFFTKDEFRVVEASESGYVKLEVERASLKAFVEIESAEAFQTIKEDKFDKNRKPLLSVSSWIIVGFVGIVIVVVLFFTTGANFLSSEIAKLIPVETEAEFGKAFFQQSISQANVNKDSVTTAVLKKCAKIVEGFSNGRAYAFHIVIVEDSIKNAFALPGGYIVVYRGILDLMENQDEFFGLLGHECGHVYLQHGFKRVIRSSLIALTVAMIFGDAGGISAILLDNGKALLNLAYDRSEESAADEFGFDALAKAGADTYGIVSLFEKLDKASGNLQMPAFLSTHPNPKARVKELMKKSPKKSNKKFLTDAEWQALKRK